MQGDSTPHWFDCHEFLMFNMFSAFLYHLSFRASKNQMDTQYAFWSDRQHSGWVSCSLHYTSSFKPQLPRRHRFAVSPAAVSLPGWCTQSPPVAARPLELLGLRPSAWVSFSGFPFFFEKGKHNFELEGESSCCFSLGSSLQPTTTAHLVGFDDIEAKLLNSEVQGQDRRVWVHPRHLSSNLQCGTYHIDSLSVKMMETKLQSGCWNVPAGRGVQLQLGYNLREPLHLTTSIHNIHIHPIDPYGL